MSGGSRESQSGVFRRAASDGGVVAVCASSACDVEKAAQKDAEGGVHLYILKISVASIKPFYQIPKRNAS